MIKTNQYDVQLSTQDEPAIIDERLSSSANTGQNHELLKEAFTKAKSIVDAANSYSSKHIQQAVERINIEESKTRIRSQQEGYAQGFAEGKQEGYEQGILEGKKFTENRNEELFSSYGRLIAELEDKQHEILTKYESTLTDLALLIAQAVIRKEFDKNNAVIPELVEAVLEEYQDQEWVRVYVSNDMVKIFETNPQLLERYRSLSKGMKWIAAPKLSDTDCIIELPTTVIDVGVDSQIEKIKSVIKW